MCVYMLGFALRSTQPTAWNILNIGRARDPPLQKRGQTFTETLHILTLQ